MKAILRVGSLSVASAVLAKNGIEGVRSYFVNACFPLIRFKVASWKELNRIVQEINECGHCGCCIKRVKESKKRAVGAGSRG